MIYIYQLAEKELSFLCINGNIEIFHPDHPFSARFSFGDEKYFTIRTYERLPELERFLVEVKHCEIDLDDPQSYKNVCRKDKILTHYILDKKTEAIKGQVFWEEDNQGYFGYIDNELVYQIHEQTSFLTEEKMKSYELNKDFYSECNTTYIYPIQINFLVQNIVVCPNCLGDNLKRNGTTSGNQRWLCKNCNRTFTGNLPGRPKREAS